MAGTEIVSVSLVDSSVHSNTQYVKPSQATTYALRDLGHQQSHVSHVSFCNIPFFLFFPISSSAGSRLVLSHKSSLQALFDHFQQGNYSQRSGHSWGETLDQWYSQIQSFFTHWELFSIYFSEKMLSKVPWVLLGKLHVSPSAMCAGRRRGDTWFLQKSSCTPAQHGAAVTGFASWKRRVRTANVMQRWA